MSEPQDLRTLFLLRKDVAFLNHGSFGACPQPVFEAYQRWQRELEEEPVEFLDRRFEDLMAEAHQSLAAYVGADPSDLVFVPNVGKLLAQVKHILFAQCLPTEAPGDSATLR